MGLILLAVLMGIVQMVFYGNPEIFNDILQSTFSSAKTGFEISLGLTGVLALWMGIMKIGEQAGVIRSMSRAVSPFFQRLFPELPKGHPAFGSMLMNISATMLGIDNAATPLGLQAMKEMQESNTEKSRASNSMPLTLPMSSYQFSSLPILPPWRDLSPWLSHRESICSTVSYWVRWGD